MTDKILIHTTWGPTDPTRAGIAMAYAKVAKKKGMDVSIFLFHDAVLLAQKDMYENVVPMGPPPLKSSMGYLLDENVPIYVCKPCYKQRGLNPKNLVFSASLEGMDIFFELSKDHKVMGF